MNEDLTLYTVDFARHDTPDSVSCPPEHLHHRGLAVGLEAKSSSLQEHFLSVRDKLLLPRCQSKNGARERCYLVTKGTGSYSCTSVAQTSRFRGTKVV